MRNVYEINVSKANRPCYRCEKTIKPLDTFIIICTKNLCAPCMKEIFNAFTKEADRLEADAKSAAKELEAQSFKKKITIGYRNKIFDALVASGLPKNRLFKESDAGSLNSTWKRSPTAGIEVYSEITGYWGMRARIIVKGSGDIEIRKYVRQTGEKATGDFRNDEISATIPAADPNGIEKTVEIITTILSGPMETRVSE